MLKLLKNLFPRKVKRIAFLDGDQPIPGLLKAYDQHIKGTNTETHLVRWMQANHNEPSSLKAIDPNINKVYLRDFRAGKEVSDKFIGQWMQKAVLEGYTHITVVSSDYDFVDIFKMIAKLSDVKDINFRLIVSMNQDQIPKWENKVANMQIVKA